MCGLPRTDVWHSIGRIPCHVARYGTEVFSHILTVLFLAACRTNARWKSLSASNLAMRVFVAFSAESCSRMCTAIWVFSSPLVLLACRTFALSRNQVRGLVAASKSALVARLRRPARIVSTTHLVANAVLVDVCMSCASGESVYASRGNIIRWHKCSTEENTYRSSLDTPCILLRSLARQALAGVCSCIR